MAGQNKNDKSGYIKSYRSTTQKGWYKKSEYFHLWHHLLYKANYQDNEWLYKNKLFKVKRGQFITSRKSLALETGINESMIERILKCFEIEQQIEQQNLFISRLISILNYDVYQEDEQQDEQQVNSKRTLTKKVKKVKKNNTDDLKKKSPEEKFFLFWECYHEITLKEKTDKEPAFRKWKRLTLSQQQDAYKGIEKYADWCKRKYGNSNYIKKARTYLNDKTWEDDLTIKRDPSKIYVE